MSGVTRNQGYEVHREAARYHTIAAQQANRVAESEFPRTSQSLRAVAHHYQRAADNHSEAFKVAPNAERQSFHERHGAVAAALASRHDREATDIEDRELQQGTHNMKLTDNQRADLIDKAILNGACEGDRALLNSLSDRSLIAMNDTFGAGGRFDMKPGQKGGYLQAGGKGTPDEYKLSGNKDVDDDEDEEDKFGRKGKRSDNSRGANGINSNASGSSGGVNNNRDGSVEQWLTANNAPPAIRSAVTNAVQLERRQKIDIIGRLVSNVTDNGQRRRLVDNLIKKDLGELSDMLSMMPTNVYNQQSDPTVNHQGSQDLQPLYMGANSPYGGFDNLTANVDNTQRDDLPIPPVMNFAEWAKEDRERNAG